MFIIIVSICPKSVLIFSLVLHFHKTKLRSAFMWSLTNILSTAAIRWSWFCDIARTRLIPVLGYTDDSLQLGMIVSQVKYRVLWFPRSTIK